MSDVVQQVGGLWHTLDGIEYGYYIEHLTYLLFLKMADELDVALPEECDWPSLMGKSGTALQEHYLDVLRKLGKRRGLLGSVFRRPQSGFDNPVNLKKLIGLIDETDWTTIIIDTNAAQFGELREGSALDEANEELDLGERRQVFKLLILCRRLLAILIKESLANNPG